MQKTGSCFNKRVNIHKGHCTAVDVTTIPVSVVTGEGFSSLMRKEAGVKGGRLLKEISEEICEDKGGCRENKLTTE
jgi:hypothetical protein